MEMAAVEADESVIKIEREFRILSALQESAVPVPKMHGICIDATVLGTAFYIMEYLDGRIFDDPSFPNVMPQEREQM